MFRNKIIKCKSFIQNITDIKCKINIVFNFDNQNDGISDVLVYIIILQLITSYYVD